MFGALPMAVIEVINARTMIHLIEEQGRHLRDRRARHR
jgi:hypothetical protein